MRRFMYWRYKRRRKKERIEVKHFYEVDVFSSPSDNLSKEFLESIFNENKSGFDRRIYASNYKNE